MPRWYQASDDIWHLTALREGDTIIPCLMDLFVYSGNTVERLPSDGIVCIKCLRCWDAVNCVVPCDG